MALEVCMARSSVNGGIFHWIFHCHAWLLEGIQFSGVCIAPAWLQRVRDHIQNGVKKLLNVPNVSIADEVNYKHLHGILLTLIYSRNIHDINSEFLGTCQSTHPTSAAYYTNSQRQCLLSLNLLFWEWCIVKGQRLPTTEHRNGTLEPRNISAAKLCWLLHC